MRHRKSRDLANARGHFRPIKKVDLTLEVVARIKELLTRGELHAGSRLPTERELAEMLGISRPSVRQALKALSFMGLIRARQGAGTYISDSAVDILSRPLEFLPLVRNLPLSELFEARMIVEVKAAALAARRATDDDLNAMCEALEACRKHLKEPKKFVLDEIRFHKAVYCATGNSVLIQAMDMLYNLLHGLRLRSVSAASDLGEMLEYHVPIYEAIACRDEAAAIRAMEKHFDYTEALLSRKGLLAKTDGHLPGSMKAE